MYLSHMHNFRGVAICGIIGAHTLHNFVWEPDSILFSFFDTLFNQSSIWFFFIAGFLFQYLSPKYETVKYYRTKLKNVVLPYLIMSVPALYFFTQISIQNSVPGSFYELGLWQQISLLLLTGKHLAPFWFVPTISIIYLTAPVLLMLDRTKLGYWMLLPVLLVLSAWLGRDGLSEVTGWSPYLSPFSKAFYLLSVYMFGMFCGRHHNRLLEIMPRLHIPVVTVAVGCFIANMIMPETYYMFGFKIATCLLLVYYLFLLDEPIGRKLVFLGSISFGLFFVHGYIVGGTKIVSQYLTGQSDFGAGALLPYLGFTAFVIGLCTILLWAAMKVFGKKSRMIVGC